MMGLCRVYIKNANGQLQFASNVVLQAIGHYVYSSTADAIKWVDCGSWLSQPESVECDLGVVSGKVVDIISIIECYMASS